MRQNDAFVVFIATKIFVGIFALAERLQTSATLILGKPSAKKSAVFLNIVQKAFAPPPLSFEHYVVNFSEGILTKVR